MQFGILLVVSLVSVALLGPACTAPQQTVWSARGSDPGYPEPAHVFSKDRPGIEQLYLGDKRPIAEVALIGRFTWVDGYRRAYIKRLTESTGGMQWQYSVDGSHAFLEVPPGTYEVVYGIEGREGTWMVQLATAAGETYALYPDGFKPVGAEVSMALRREEIWRSISLPDVSDLKHSRFFTALCGMSINSGGTLVSTMSFETFHVDHSTSDEIQSDLGKPDTVVEANGLMRWTFDGVAYATELQKRAGTRLSSNTPSRPLRLAFDAAGMLREIQEP